MKKISLGILISVITVTFTAILISVKSFAWGDNGGGRESYTIEEINNGAIGDTDPNGENYPGTIVFNSISDSVIGDEKNFVGARACFQRPDGTWIGATKDTIWENDIEVEDGQTYILRIYVHNNNPNGTNAISYDTKVAFSIPSDSAKQIQVNGFITSSNATPSEYWDYVNFNSDTAFHLDYIYGSALLENNGIGKGGLTLNDDVVRAVSGGTLIGYDKLDGCVPGCYQYDGYVTIKVRAVFDYDYTVETKVRHAGDKEWQDTIEANVGDMVEFQIRYTNTSEVRQVDVAMRNVLPNNLRYIPGSTKIKNSNYPNGGTVNSDALVANGIKIGNHAAGGGTVVMFTAEVIDNNLAPGSNILVNWGQAGVGSTVIQDYARVVVYNDIFFRVISTILLVLIAICLIIITFLFCKMYHQKRTSLHTTNKD